MAKIERVAVVLSGCGFMDGSEIHEAVLTLWALSKRGITHQCFAPDKPQAQVVDHLSGEPANDARNVLVEAARIARGAVKPLDALKAADFDALVFPGGFGAASSLSDFAAKGAECGVDASAAQAIRSFHESGKPIVALCISPVLLARVLGKGALTVGEDAQVNAALKAMGAEPRNTSHGEVVVDPELKLVTSPCYMLDASVAQIAAGADNAIEALVQL